MICDVCKQEISYDRETVSFHLNEKCLIKPRVVLVDRFVKIDYSDLLEEIRKREYWRK